MTFVGEAEFISKTPFKYGLAKLLTREGSAKASFDFDSEVLIETSVAAFLHDHS